MALVCSCNAVGERRVRRTIESGASTVAEVAARCGAGDTCYGCHPTIEDMIDDASGDAVQAPNVRRLFAS